jgi:hypothetical protein
LESEQFLRTRTIDLLSPDSLAIFCGITNNDTLVVGANDTIPHDEGSGIDLAVAAL